MVVITISYPHTPRYNSFNYTTSSTSASPTLSNTSSEQLPSPFQVSSDGDTLATSKQEEWITKRKTELVTTKQIETRVKRQVVLEDGKVVEDSGPLVTTTTTEDTDKNESEHTEHKQHGEDQDVGEGWVAIDTTVPEDAVVKETNERKVTTHDEVEDILETEEVQHFGDMTNQNLVRAIREGSDTRRALLTNDRRDLTPLSSYDKDSKEKRILQQSKRHDRTTDIEDTNEVSKVNDIGNLVTEITRRHEHEEFHNEDIPSSDESDEFEHVENRDGSHDYSHAKSQNYIDYLAAPKGGGKGVKDLKNRHDDVTRSLNSQFGQQQRSSSMHTKSGSLWDEEPTPTPPPRSRRSRHSPDARYSRSPDHTEIIHRGSNINNMNQYSRKFTSSPPDGLTSSYHQLSKSNDIGERKGYERREHSFGYSGPTSQSDQYGHSDYVTKHSNYYKTDETNNPAQNTLYENGKADVTEKKTVERREKVFSYDGPSQKQFHPKYILGTPASTMGRLKGIEGTGAIIEEDADSSILSPSQMMPRKRFYFGDEDGGLHKPSITQQRITSGRSATIESRERRHGTDDINVSILNKYNNDTRRPGSGGSGLNRSMSFTPKTLTPLERSYNTLQQNSSTLLQQTQKHHQAYKSNPHLVDSPDLLSPRLISSMSRSSRDVNRNDLTNGTTYSNKQESAARSRQTFLENIKRSSADLFDRTTTGSPVRTITPTKSLRSASSPRPFGTNSPISDDFQETHRMTSSTPDGDRGKPKISTDTTSKFSKKILRGLDGQPSGKVESSETTTRTKSRYKESEVMYPNGRRVASPSSDLRSDFGRRTNQGTVIIPVRDTNTGRSRYAS